MKREELNQRIDSLLDGDCSEADFLALEAELHIDPDARATYYERVKLHTGLKDEGRAQSAQEKKIISFPLSNRRLTQAFTGIAAAAAVIFLGLLWWTTNQRGNEPTETLATGFGVIDEQSDAVWKGLTLNPGDLIPAGRVQLESGMAQLELFSGVTILLEGEVDFELLSSMEMSIDKGKVRAVVPKPAQGFRVRTVTGDVVDLGTEFSLNVTEDHADLHVIDGEVEWHPVAKPMRTLVDGEALRWTKKGEATPEKDNIASLSQLLSIKDQRIQKWQSHSQQMHSDPRLLAYFPMETPG
ncbi:MAG: FecR family protein, partial [Verrucomicrobiota bacterium]